MRVEILGIPVDGISEDEAAALIFNRITGRSPDTPPCCVVTPNPLMIMESRKKFFHSVLNYLNLIPIFTRWH